MEDITPRKAPPVNSSPYINPRQAIPLQSPPPTPLQPTADGRQPVRPLPRSRLVMNDMVTTGRRPIARPITRPIQRSSQDITGNLNPVPNTTSNNSINNNVQVTSPSPHSQPRLATVPYQQAEQPLDDQFTAQLLETLPQETAQTQQYYPAPTLQRSQGYQSVKHQRQIKSLVLRPLSRLLINAKKSPKATLQVGLKATLAIVVLAAATQLFSWFSIRYLSIYNPLTPASYSKQNDLSFNLIHPKVMKYDSSVAGVLKFTPVAYSYNLSSEKEALIDVSYTPVGATLKTLKLTPAQVLSQIKANSGSYIDYLNKTEPGLYKQTYAGCNNFIATTSGSNLLCTVNGTNGTVTHIIDATPGYLYSLNLYIPKSIWLVHQNVWQKVEKSFNAQ